MEPMSLIKPEQLIKEAGRYYEISSAPLRLRCPVCSDHKSRRCKTYHSLKSLSWHLAYEHRDHVGYPSLEQIQELLKYLALAIQWEILV